MLNIATAITGGSDAIGNGLASFKERLSRRLLIGLTCQTRKNGCSRVTINVKRYFYRMCKLSAVKTARYHKN
ncbi:hypothetical protein BBBOND_0400860 [Babesia bigemina]|uniref:Uncharacterized protein n=1 Tax=Babesia bigemina TaxID=5866 RepID=A0A061DDP7_BABBI|nr:hypothetical protein BBBOND_0400860 [Babesia bigemina]CDR97594.1 hypothetical protein BBBOND_0400860 [Babesia bigemina]|eukprot:XP_012769780.1 hypothetical protein BBBOND_0400860 [Babesia bigemina]